MPPGKYGMQEEWEKEGDQRIVMDFLLPTGIFLKFPVSRNDTIRIIKKVQPFPGLGSVSAKNSSLNLAGHRCMLKVCFTHTILLLLGKILKWVVTPVVMKLIRF